MNNALLLPSIVDDIENGNYTESSSINIAFFQYIGANRSVQTIYDENVSSVLPFEKNYNYRNQPYFVEETISNFIKSNNRIYLFELNSFNSSQNTDDIDAIYFGYVILLYHKLVALGIRSYYVISGIPTVDKRYTPVTKHDYHRLRSFLFLETLYGINQRVYMLTEFSEIWVKLYSVGNEQSITNPLHKTRIIMDDTEFGKILPLIEINGKTYGYFHKKAYPKPKTLGLDIYEYRLRELLDCYINRINGELQKDDKDLLNQILKCDSLFEALLFVSTLYFITVDSGVPNEIAKLHENCMDYAQGIFQLIENSYYHVVKDTQTGWGNISFRIRQKKEKDRANKFDYEIYVSDISSLSKDSVGIINGLIKNFPSLKGSNIKLSDMFHKTTNSDYSKFLSDNNNIAHHYGLMILNNAVMSNNGVIRVRSTNRRYASDDPSDSEMLDYPWYAGTTYYIRIPIIVDARGKSYLDTIGSNNITLTSEQPAIQTIRIDALLPKEKLCFCSSIEKELAINKLAESLRSYISSSETIYIVDCSSYIFQTEFEVLSKAIFLLLSNNPNATKVALINIVDRFYLLKLFRQFALFYDRKGENRYLSNKGVFLVDKRAQLPLLLMGHIGDIVQELYELELSGQIDESAIAIINCLGRRTDETRRI